MTGLDPRDIALLLRQRQEMGAGEMFLDQGSRAALLKTVRAAAPSADDVPAALGSSTAGASTSGAPAATPAVPVVRPAEPTPRGRPAPPDGDDASNPWAAGASGRPSATDSKAKNPAKPTVAPSATPGAPPKVDGVDYDALREMALGCTRCGLSETRQQVVFSDGNPNARLVIVGEAPGANEDKTGVPFVGAAGKLLDLMLASVDLSRKDSVYICNVLKCRPPGNRNPTPEEIRTCSPFLHRQLELVKPRALLAVGTFAAQVLTGQDDALGKLRGKVYSYEGIPLVVTYHPAALLRNSGWARPTWDDLQLLRQVMDGG